MDSKVFKPSRLARVPYTIHNESKRTVTPLDNDFRAIDIGSFSLELYISKTLPNTVVEEARQRREAVERIRAAKKVLELYRLSQKTIKSP